MASTSDHSTPPADGDSPKTGTSVGHATIKSTTDDRGPALRLYVSLSQAYRDILSTGTEKQQLDGIDGLSLALAKIRRGNQTLVLWARDFRIADGDLDIVIANSRRLRGLILKYLTKINRAAIQGRRLLATLAAEKNRDSQHGESDHHTSPQNQRLTHEADMVNEIAEIADDLQNHVECLMGLAPMMEEPLKDYAPMRGILSPDPGLTPRESSPATPDTTSNGTGYRERTEASPSNGSEESTPRAGSVTTARSPQAPEDYAPANTPQNGETTSESQKLETVTDDKEIDDPLSEMHSIITLNSETMRGLPHDFSDWAYYFPVESSDLEIADMRYGMFSTLCGRLWLAPLTSPKRIAELGTGTGIWTIDVGDEFPEADVIGIDLNPSQPTWVPPNVTFFIDNIEKPNWRLKRDFIFSRDLNLAVRDFAGFVENAHGCLTPEGWIEVQFLDHQVDSDTNAIDATHPVPRFWGLIKQGMSALGANVSSCSEGVVARMLQDQGFTEVAEHIFKLPIGGWENDASLKLAGNYWQSLSISSAKSIAQFPLRKGLQWGQDRIDMEILHFQQAMRDFEDLSKHCMYMKFYVVYGQKPSADS
ncbi:S-adenosyl-L-methionine-dependent methyltransferase [Podospora aff. communis PSN243]|uniref:S-adenosyl-L-methionine-dependent methyltransferase n=1 Tax=Podospora aff. communis PSN243 TaxID=3040156 RepID=A0AAV9GDI7_9PEZI|nr:S-adenosyl-L-methionine-dependent methyltransferase [Podospora aff. communis PSN243]